MSKLYIYRNLNKGLMFSIKQNGLVVDRQEVFKANGATFKVSEAGRQRAIRTKTRNVHAFVVTENINIGETLTENERIEIKYNPFRSNTFTNADGVPIEQPCDVYFVNGKAYIKKSDND